MGDVKSPSSIPYRNALTAMQAIGMAGGFLRTGAERDVSIIRLSSDGYLRAIPVDATVGGQPGPYLAFALTRLEPDDVLFVPESNRSQATRFINDLILLPTQLLLNFKLIRTL
jgi:polysaccharide export outer membrane protein